ncbi:MAG: hypothetical protein V7749_12955 [Cocleimonas sp.]
MKAQILKMKTSINTFLMLSMIAATTGSYADDTEVFYSANVSKPNLLFLLDVSGSMSTRVPNSGISTNNTVASTVNRRIVNSRDDAEQASSGGAMLLSDTYLDMGYDYYDFTAPARVGLRFYNLGIPDDAEITNAYIQFEVRQATSSDIELFIVADATNDSLRFSGSGNGLISARTASTVSIDWDPPAWNTVNDRGLDQRTPDLTTLVQSMIEIPGWSENNGMSFIIEGRAGNEGNRVAKSYDRGADDAPMLVIEYNSVAPGVDKTRLEVMQDSLRRVLEKAPDNVNVGLMNYGLENLRNSNPEERRMHAVSGVSFPITDINDNARSVILTANDVHGLPSWPAETAPVREYLADIADTWVPSSWTPIVDALYEAALYFRGEKVHYGQSLPSRGGAHPSTYEGGDYSDNNGVVDQLVFDEPGRLRAKTPTYKSPIVSSCQANYIVLMTDGEPTYSGSGNTKGPFAERANITVGGPQGPLANAVGSCAGPAGVGDAGTCGAELTQYLATNDNVENKSDANPNGLDGSQTIETFSIGFGTATGSNNEQYLKSVATYVDGGNNGYYAASTPEELAAAFQGILEAVAAPTGTLASPGYSVNVKNGLENEKDVYIPVFDRKNSSRWSGNLKKFKIVDVDGKRLIRGKNNKNATEESGGFTDQALDYWSTSTNPDGGEVEAGGVANLLTDPAARKIISNLTGDVNVDLSDAANAVSEANIANITNDLLGLPTTTDLALRKQIVNFMRGYVDGDTSAGARKHMGDMLHTEPAVITYEKGGSGKSKQQYVFAATNEGYVHAFDAVTGEEKFAFMPKELLKIAEPQFRNAGTQVDHKYGVDGIMEFRFIGGADGSVDSGDQIIMYFGLRRGGNSFYALDITNIDAPKLLWTKTYPSMGQSWSKPNFQRVGKQGSTCSDGRVNCQDVIIISGGYDGGDVAHDINAGGPDGISEDRNKADGSKEVDDATAVLIPADVGNDILILDAYNGNKVWSMPTSMRNQITSSIPGGLTILDYNQNKLADRIYFADTGGIVWRLDLSESIGDSTAPETQLIKFADLGSQGRSSDRRMFFNEPDVATMKLNGRSVYTVSLGSGFRAHPMDETIDDRFYVLVDHEPYSRIVLPSGVPFDTITETDLAVITVNNSSATKTGEITDPSKKGWVFKFTQTGEKVLAKAKNSDGNIIFSTLIPEAASSGSGVDQCSAPITKSVLYKFKVITGSLEEKIEFNVPGILNPPQEFFNEPTYPPAGNIDDPVGVNEKGEQLDADGNVVPVCSHEKDFRIGTAAAQIGTEDTCSIEGVYWSDPVTQ